MKECAWCKKEYEAKRETSKFCSDSCRVMQYRNNNKGKPKKEIGKLELTNLYNSILELIEKSTHTFTPNSIQPKQEINKPYFDKPDEREEETKKVTYSEYLILKRECESYEDWVELSYKIKNDKDLPNNHKKLLLSQ